MLCTQESPLSDTLLPAWVWSHLTSASDCIHHLACLCKGSISLSHSSGKFHFSINRSLDQVLESWLTCLLGDIFFPPLSHIQLCDSQNPHHCSFWATVRIHSLDPLLSDVGPVLSSGQWNVGDCGDVCIRLWGLAHKS